MFVFQFANIYLQQQQNTHSLNSAAEVIQTKKETIIMATIDWKQMDKLEAIQIEAICQMLDATLIEQSQGNFPH